MKIYNSFRPTDVNKLDDDVYALSELSVLSSLDSYGNIHLITSEEGADFFHKLPYTSIELYDECDILLNSDDLKFKNTWTIPKMLAYKQIVRKGEPFLHIDYDFFLFKKLPDYINKSSVVVQHKEHRADIGLWYFIPLFEELCPEKPFYDSKIDYAFNCGIFGGNNYDFFNFYLDTAFQIFNNPKNYAFWTETRHWASKVLRNEWTFEGGVIEQYWLAQCLKEKSIEPTFLLDSSGSNDLWDFMDKTQKQAENLGITHLIGYTKQNQSVLNLVRNKIKTLKNKLGLIY